MGKYISCCGALALASLLTSGCSDTFWIDKNGVRLEQMTADSTLITNADYRAIHRIAGRELRVSPVYPPIEEVKPDGTKVFEPGTRPQWVYQYVPHEMICSEPSPDVTKAISAAFSGAFGGTGKATNPAGNSVGIELAARADAARSEAVGQLTKRIATIQLLRDGLYQACLAFANGAISSDIYTSIVSRYDKMMITMLLGEMAVGNFGTAITLGGGASAGAGGDAAALQAAVDSATTAQLATNNAVTGDLKAKSELQTKLADATKTAQGSGDPTKPVNTDPKVVAAQQAVDNQDQTIALHKAALDAANQKVAKAQSALALGTGRASTSSTGQVSGTPALAPSAQVAEVLYRMQRAYLNDPQFNTLVHVCMDTMARNDVIAVSPGRGELTGYCNKIMDIATDKNLVGKQHDGAIEVQQQDIQAISASKPAAQPPAARSAPKPGAGGAAPGANANKNVEAESTRQALDLANSVIAASKALIDANKSAADATKSSNDAVKNAADAVKTAADQLKQPAPAAPGVKANP